MTMLQATETLKWNIEHCFQMTHDLAQCQPGHHGIPSIWTPPPKSGLARAECHSEGRIHLIPEAKNGFSGQDDVWLIPKIESGWLYWSIRGHAVQQGYVTHYE